MRRIPRALTGALLTALLAGCAPGAPDHGPGEELVGDWHLTAASDRRGPMELDGAEITLAIGEHATKGAGPCSTVDLEVDGGPGAIAVTIGSLTEGACADENLIGVEGRYITVLSNVVFAEVGETTLVLRGRSGKLTYARD
jgi:hypothetical protein